LAGDEGNKDLPTVNRLRIWRNVAC
jgi:hypothetical protein